MLFPLSHAIVQTTQFCNIDCRYCYVPGRQIDNRIEVATITNIAQRIVEYDVVAEPLLWTWHAGEPLTVGLSHFSQCHFAAKSVFSAHDLKVAWSVQTNGTLLDERWADFFVEEQYSVRISIDGPADLHDRSRRTRSGQGTHKRAIRGFQLMKERNQTTPILLVVSLGSLDRGAEIMKYFGRIGAKSIALNFEEMEGANRRSSFSLAGVSSSDLRKKVMNFIAEMVSTRNSNFPDIEIREHDNFLRLVKDGRQAESFVTAPMYYLTFGCDGFVYAFSPELAGHKKPDGTTFSIGNVNEEGLNRMLDRVLASKDYSSITNGKEMCRNSCEYFAVCGGGNPGNKYFENGTFCSTETEHCRMRYQYLVDGILATLNLD